MKKTKKNWNPSSIGPKYIYSRTNFGVQPENDDLKRMWTASQRACPIQNYIIPTSYGRVVFVNMNFGEIREIH
jgi:hypothetical protein